MIESSIARRYARALLAIGQETGRQERFADELEGLAAAIDQDRELRAVLMDPGFGSAKRRALIDAMGSKLSLDPEVANFLRLLEDRQRLAVLPDIARALRDLVDRQQGRVRAVVTSPAPLAAEQVRAIHDTLAKATGKNLSLETKTDPSLIGGLVTQVGAVLFDGSVRTQLERMRQKLKGEVR